MAKIAIFPFPAPGHIFGTKNLIEELESRGHIVVIYVIEDGLKYFEEEFKNVKIFGKKRLPMGSLHRLAGKTKKTSGISAFTQGLYFLRFINAEVLNVDAEGFDLIIQDELFIREPKHRGKSVAYASSITSRMNSKGKSLPLIENSHLLTKNFLRFLNFMTPGRVTLEALHQKDLFLNCYTHSLISIDAPLKNTFFTGPWIGQLDLDPVTTKKSKLIYVSLGTLVDHERKMKILTQVRDVCEDLKIKTIISWGSHPNFPLGLSPTEHVQIVSFTNQIEVLKKACLMINHGGINSVQECVLTLTPMICLPLKHDQPYVARRVQEQGLGSVLCPSSKNFADELKRMINAELENGRTSSLKRLRDEIVEAGGIKAAVTAIENLL